MSLNKFSILRQYIRKETPPFLLNLVYDTLKKYEIYFLHQPLFVFFTFSILYEISNNNVTAANLRTMIFEGFVVWSPYTQVS